MLYLWLLSSYAEYTGTLSHEDCPAAAAAAANKSTADEEEDVEVDEDRIEGEKSGTAVLGRDSICFSG